MNLVKVHTQLRVGGGLVMGQIVMCCILRGGGVNCYLNGYDGEIVDD